MESITIVIPNYNGLDLLKKNLQSIIKLKETYDKIKEIIIVDDASTDTSASYINKTHPKITLVKKAVNSGFSETVNIGFKNVKTSLVLLLNTDVRPRQDLIDNLLPYFSDSSVFAVGCLEKSKENEKTVERGRGIGVFKKGFLIHKRGDVNKDNTLWVSGGSSMFRKDIWDKLGGFDLAFGPFYWEDIDISYRALKSGYKIYFAKNAVVYHEHEEGAIKTHYEPSYVDRIAYRNQIMFFWKNISDVRYILKHVMYLFYNLALFVFTGRFQYIYSYLEVIKDLPHIVKERSKLKKHWKYSDQVILQQFNREFNQS